MSGRILNDHPFRTIELIARVAEIAYDNKDYATLRSCTLVDRSWRMACRIFIFRRIRIVSEERLDAFDALLDADPAIGPLVHELTIQPERKPVPEPVAWVAEFPSKLSMKLTDLKALQFVQLYELGEYMLDPFFHELARFRTVTRLTIRDSCLAMRMIFAFASALPGITDLQIGHTNVMPTNRWEPPPVLSNPSLSSVEVHIGNTSPRAVEESFAWILSTNTRAVLHSLDVLVYFAQVGTVMSALEVLGAQLRHLVLRFGLVFDSPLEYQMIKDGLFLSPCRGLRTLAFHTRDPASEAIVSLLDEVSSPDIRMIAFHISPDARNPAAFPDCTALNAALSSANLLCLEEVCFQYEGPLHKQEVLERVRRDLPAIHTRGLLRVVFA